MKLKINKEDGKLTISIDGRLDTSTAPELENCINENIAGVKELIFDLKDLVYTASAGLRVFLKAKKNMNSRGEMKIVNTSEDVMEVFDLTGFAEIMNIE